MEKLLFNYFGSIEFLGVLFLSAGFCCLLMPTFHSWFASKQRCFWLVKLTYEDADTQVLVRSTWIAGILLFAIGAILVSINNSGKVAWVLCEIAYLVVYAWLLLKAILLISIIGLSLWNWAVHGKFLFNKK